MPLLTQMTLQKACQDLIRGTNSHDSPLSSASRPSTPDSLQDFEDRPPSSWNSGHSSTHSVSKQPKKTCIHKHDKVRTPRSNVPAVSVTNAERSSQNSVVSPTSTPTRPRRLRVNSKKTSNNQKQRRKDAKNNTKVHPTVTGSLLSECLYLFFICKDVTIVCIYV